MSLQNLGKLSTLVNVFDSLSKSQKTFKLEEFVNTAKNFVGSMDMDTAIIGLKKLGIEGDDLIDTLIKMGYKTEDVATALTKVGSAGASNVGFITKLKTAYTGLAATIGISTTALTSFLAVAAGITAVIAGVKMYDEYIQKQVDKAREAGNSWSETNSSFDSQTAKIRELKASLDSGTLSEEEAYNGYS